MRCSYARKRAQTMTRVRYRNRSCRRPRVTSVKLVEIRVRLRGQRCGGLGEKVIRRWLPLVVLLEQHRADQPDDRGFVRKDAGPMERKRDPNQLQHRYMQVEVMAELTVAAGADPRQIPCAA
jgi:hypothetical protein